MDVAKLYVSEWFEALSFHLNLLKPKDVINGKTEIPVECIFVQLSVEQVRRRSK